MKRLLPIAALIVIGLVLAGATIPMWISTSGMGLSGHGYAALFLMIVFAFVVGGGLMFLIFYSARKGYDDRVRLDHIPRVDADSGGHGAGGSRPPI
jgi:hypothetical protein